MQVRLLPGAFDMAKKRGCCEWPNCECPKCEAYRKRLDHVFSWDMPGMGGDDAKDKKPPHPGFGGKVGQGKPKWMKDLFGGPCHYCGQPAFTMDHKIPKVRGGSNARSNLLLACAPCNRLKGDMSYDQFLELLKGRYPGKAKA
jgi:5-methylcytosine-specific restriction endonuclease McrA